MPAKKDRGTINDMPTKPSPYGDQIAKAVMFLVGVGMFVLFLFDILNR